MRDTLIAAVRAKEEGGGNDLIKVVPGLMIWTTITFAIVFFVLKKLAFGRIQGLIDQRRDRIAEALDEADHAREEARSPLAPPPRLGGGGGGGARGEPPAG